MNCCVNCFKDVELKKLVEQDNILGKCDFCASEGVAICSSEETTERLGEYLTSILDLYEVATDNKGKALSDVT